MYPSQKISAWKGEEERPEHRNFEITSNFDNCSCPPLMIQLSRFALTSCLNLAHGYIWITQIYWRSAKPAPGSDCAAFCGPLLLSGDTRRILALLFNLFFLSTAQVKMLKQPGLARAELRKIRIYCVRDLPQSVAETSCRAKWNCRARGFERLIVGRPD